MKIARVYLRVSSEEQDLARQERLIEEARLVITLLVFIVRRLLVPTLIDQNYCA